MHKGLVHIYHGYGKGKTTCGMGLCVRAAGAGLKVLVYQFLKDDRSSEINVLRHIPGITVMEGVQTAKFVSKMSDEEKSEARKFYQAEFDKVTRKAIDENIHLLFLDEILHAINFGMINKDKVLDFLRNRPQDMEVVLTGYDPDHSLREAADYISCIQKEKHPYDKGIKSRVGIEK